MTEEQTTQPREQAAEPPRAQPADDASLIRATPGLVRIAASAWWHAAGWTARVSVRTGSRVVRAAVSGQSPRDLFEAAGADAREYARRLLGIVDPEGRLGDAAPQSLRGLAGGAAAENGAPPSLRERGEDLLRRSADVRFEEDAHPAYERMLGELAPDEGRILRLLEAEGPQPAVDVRSGWLHPLVSDLVDAGLTMIGAEAGCRYPEQVRSYLNNLNRMGLVWFSREPVSDPLRYQVLEAQPEVTAAMRRASRPRTVRRSIHLTPFGHDFCSSCLPVDERGGERDGAGAPPQRDAGTDRTGS